MSLESDALLAATGILAPSIGPRELAASQAVPAVWEKRLRAWVTAPQAPFAYKPPPNLERVWMRLAAPPSQAEIEPLVAALGVDDPMFVADYWLGLMAARNHMVAIWPKWTIMTLSGPHLLPLSQDDIEEVSSVLSVLENPDTLLSELYSRTITANQVAAFKVAFPDLYDFANSILDDAIAAQLAKNFDWAPPWDQEDVLRVFRGAPPEIAPPPPPPPPAPPKPLEINADREKTQSEISSAPKGSAAPSK